MCNGELDRDHCPELCEEPDLELSSEELDRDHCFRLWNGDVIGERLSGLASGERFTELDVDESGFLGWWYANLSNKCECLFSSMANGSIFSDPVSKQYMEVVDWMGISGRLQCLCNLSPFRTFTSVCLVMRKGTMREEANVEMIRVLVPWNVVSYTGEWGVVCKTMIWVMYNSGLPIQL